MDELLENKELEVSEDKNLDEAETLAAPEEKDEIPDLNTAPIPTEEEKIDAGLATEPEEPSDSEPEPAPQPEPEPELPAEPEPQPEPEKTFTQSQVNDLIGKTRVDTRNKTFEYIYGRYGVNDENGLDELVGNAQRYDSLREEYDGEKAAWKQEADSRNSELKELAEKVALMESGIDKERYDDARFILKGKGLELTAENIANELNSHPEWKKSEELKVYTPKNNAPAPLGKISVLGNERLEPDHSESEEDVAMNKYFKV